MHAFVCADLRKRPESRREVIGAPQRRGVLGVVAVGIAVGLSVDEDGLLKVRVLRAALDRDLEPG